MFASVSYSNFTNTNLLPELPDGRRVVHDCLVAERKNRRVNDRHSFSVILSTCTETQTRSHEAYGSTFLQIKNTNG